MIFYLFGLRFNLITIISLHLVYKQFVLILIMLELSLLGFFRNFIFFSYLLNNINGYGYAFILLIIAAIELAIGLGILLKYTQQVEQLIKQWLK